MFTVEITSDFEELYRYNLMALLAGYNQLGEQQYTIGAEMIYREEVNFDIYAVATPPSDFTIGQPLTLVGEDATSIHLLIYIITNTLPKDHSSVVDAAPFDLLVTISREEEVIYETTHKINQWGGETINIKL